MLSRWRRCAGVAPALRLTACRGSMNRLFVAYVSVLAGALVQTGCKGDDGTTVPLTVELVAPSSFTGLPSFPDSALNAVDEVVIRSYTGTTFLDERIADVGEASLTLPDLPFGDDLWLSVEAYGSNPSCADSCATSGNGCAKTAAGPRRRHRWMRSRRRARSARTAWTAARGVPSAACSRPARRPDSRSAKTRGPRMRLCG